MIALMEKVLKDNISQNNLLNQGDIYINKIHSYIMDSSVIILDAFKEGVLLGFPWSYELAIFGGRRKHIDMIGVNLDYRGQGNVTKMVELQLQETKKRGISIAEDMTTKNNTNSYNRFHSVGFKDERVKMKLELNHD